MAERAQRYAAGAPGGPSAQRGARQGAARRPDGSGRQRRDRDAGIAPTFDTSETAVARTVGRGRRVGPGAARRPAGPCSTPCDNSGRKATRPRRRSPTAWSNCCGTTST
ncbi:MAG: hypothetical protein MZW92_66080 [Comamonadaceae bacterium]|nr:hypothetical protein [Comamonadaceae bacterium]